MSKILGRNTPLKSYSLTNDKSLRIKQNNNIIKISEFKSQPVIKKNILYLLIIIIYFILSIFLHHLTKNLLFPHY